MDKNLKIARKLELKTDMQVLVQKFTHGFSPQLSESDYFENGHIILEVLYEILKEHQGIWRLKNE